MKLSLLTDGERARLSEADRTFFDEAWQAVPPEREYEVRVLAMLVRAVVSHDTAGIKNAVNGSFELLDSADSAARELMDAARQFRADGEALAKRLDEAIAASLADRNGIRERLRRVEGHVIRVDGHIIALWGALFALFAVVMLWVMR